MDFKNFADNKAAGRAFLVEVDGKYFIRYKRYNPATGEEANPLSFPCDKTQLQAYKADIDAILADWDALEKQVKSEDHE